MSTETVPVYSDYAYVAMPELFAGSAYHHHHSDDHHECFHDHMPFDTPFHHPDPHDRICHRDYPKGPRVTKPKQSVEQSMISSLAKRVAELEKKKVELFTYKSVAATTGYTNDFAGSNSVMDLDQWEVTGTEIDVGATKSILSGVNVMNGREGRLIIPSAVLDGNDVKVVEHGDIYLTLPELTSAYNIKTPNCSGTIDSCMIPIDICGCSDHHRCCKPIMVKASLCADLSEPDTPKYYVVLCNQKHLYIPKGAKVSRIVFKYPTAEKWEVTVETGKST